MERKQRRFRKLIVAAVGAAVAVPALMIPASASLGGGGFFIHAQNIETPEIEATAGMLGKPGGGTPGGGIPNPGAAILASFSCGPAELDITDGMLAYSEGKSGAQDLSSEGWQGIYYMTSDYAEIKAGIPSDQSIVPPVVYLGEPGPEGFGEAKASVLDIGSMCEFTDSRGTPEAGKRIKYSWNRTAETYSDSRYMNVDGELKVVSVAVEGPKTTAVIADELLSGFGASAAPATELIVDSDTGRVTTTRRYAEAVDGYRQISVFQEADGSGKVIYQTDAGTVAPRVQGPVIIAWDSSGAIREMEYYNQETRLNTPIYENDYSDPAAYRAVTGHDWDGTYHRANDLGVSGLPFEATAPR